MSSTPAYTLPGLTDFHLRPYELAQTLHNSVLDAASAHSLYGLNLTHDFFEMSDAAFIAAWQLQNPGQPIPASLHITRSLPDFISPADMNNMNALQQRVASAQNENRHHNLSAITKIRDATIAALGESIADSIKDPVTGFRNMSSYSILQSVKQKFNNPASSTLDEFKRKLVIWDQAEIDAVNLSKFRRGIAYMQQHDRCNSRGEAIDTLWQFMQNGNDKTRSIALDFRKANPDNNWGDDATQPLGFSLRPFFDYFDRTSVVYLPTVGHAGFSAHTAAATAQLDTEIGTLQKQIAILIKSVTDLQTSGGGTTNRKPKVPPTWATQPSSIRNLPNRKYCPVHGYSFRPTFGHWGWECIDMHNDTKYTQPMKCLLTDTQNLTLKFADGTLLVPSVRNK